jgi:hypothetical protein
MKIPLGNKKKHGIQGSRTTHEFLMQVVIPGCVVWYLVYTQPAYISLIAKGETDLVTVEIIYLALHIVFTYVALPVTWTLDFLEFALRGVRFPTWLSTTLHLSTYALFWFLLIAVVLRVVAIPWYI